LDKKILYNNNLNQSQDRSPALRNKNDFVAQLSRAENKTETETEIKFCICDFIILDEKNII
jgi:hypothetical protein